MKKRFWWSVLALAAFGCSTRVDSSSGESVEQATGYLKVKATPGGLDVTALAARAETALAAGAEGAAAASTSATFVVPNSGLRRVLLLSVDGMHAADFYKWVSNNPTSNIAKLYTHGIDYPNVTTPTPSGTFPGILALTTGGSPKTTGVYDEDVFDRTLYPPGSACTGNVGTEVIYDGTLAETQANLISPINPLNLPLTLDAQGACVPVYPHNFLKASTIFEVVQSSGRRTSWTDNHASYEMLSGPSGKGISDFYSPEVTSAIVNGGTNVNGVNLTASKDLCNLTNSSGSGGTTLQFSRCVPAAQAYDDVKVQAVINKINGVSADGSRPSAVPTVLGMNFAAVDVAQRLAVGGYINALADTSPLLLSAFQHVDVSIGRILTELETKNLRDKTLVVLTSKHGQAPIDPNRWRTEYGGAVIPPPGGVGTSPGNLPSVTNPRTVVQSAWDANDQPVDVDIAKAPFSNSNSAISPSVTGHVQTGDSAIVWLQDQNNLTISSVVNVLNDPQIDEAMGATVRPTGSIFATNITSGTELADTFGDPQSATDLIAAARAPNVFVQPDLGVTYTQDTGYHAGHGGGAQDDINVPLLISNPGITSHVSVLEPVSTKQVALTILRALTLDGTKLSAAAAEKTKPLPGISWGPGTYQAGSTINAVDYSNQTSTTTAGDPPYVGTFDTGSSICFNDVYMNDVVSIAATLASANTSTNATLSVRIDGPNGTKIGQVIVLATGGWETWKTINIPLSPTQTGLHTLCFRGENSTGIANLLSFYLVPVCVPECTGATCGSNGCGGTCGTCGFNSLCDDPYGQCVAPPKKYSVVTPGLPSLIPAAASDVAVGTQTGPAGNVISFDANDYVCYYGVELNNVQKVNVTFASATATGSFSLRIDSFTAAPIATFNVTNTGGATTFKTKQIPIPLTNGTHALCIRGESGSNIAALQSFEISASPLVPKYTVGGLNVIPAVTPDRSVGTTTDANGWIANFDVNDYVCYDEVELAGVKSIVANVASATAGGVFSARLGSQTGTRIATFVVPNTGGWTTFTNVTANISPSSGFTTLCFVGESGTGIGNLKNFTLSATLQPAKYALSPGVSVIPAVPPDFSAGTTVESGGGSTWTASLDTNDYVCYLGVDLTGVNSITASVASANSGGVFSIRIISQTGTPIGQNIVLSTGGWSTFTNLSVAIAPTNGQQTLCFTGDTGSGIVNFRSFTLSSAFVTKNFSLGNTIPASPVSSQSGITITAGNVTFFDVNDWFCYDGVDLTGVHNIVANAASGTAGNRFLVRIGSQTGFQIANFLTTSTGSYNTYGNWTVPISNSPGVQKLCFFGFAGTGIGNIHSLTLNP